MRYDQPEYLFTSIRNRGALVKLSQAIKGSLQRFAVFAWFLKSSSALHLRKGSTYIRMRASIPWSLTFTQTDGADTNDYKYCALRNVSYKTSPLYLVLHALMSSVSQTTPSASQFTNLPVNNVSPSPSPDPFTFDTRLGLVFIVEASLVSKIAVAGLLLTIFVTQFQLTIAT